MYIYIYIYIYMLALAGRDGVFSSSSTYYQRPVSVVDVICVDLRAFFLAVCPVAGRDMASVLAGASVDGRTSFVRGVCRWPDTWRGESWNDRWQMRAR